MVRANGKSGRLRGRRASQAAGGTPAGLGPLLSFGAVAALIVAAVAGLEHLRVRVYRLPENRPVSRLEVVLRPEQSWVRQEDWEPRIVRSVRLEPLACLSEPDMLRMVAEQLTAGGWLSSVARVTRNRDGVIAVQGEFRRPIAMMHAHEGGYVPVDREGVRLPERYDDVSADLGWMRIIGVQSGLPEPGRAYRPEDEDALAGIRLAALLFDQGEVATRISAIDMSNFRGREDARRNHIRIWTRDQQQIEWGAAIGEEIEERPVEEKLRKLVLLLNEAPRPGRVDLTVHPNAVSVHRDPAVPTSGPPRGDAGGSNS